MPTATGVLAIDHGTRKTGFAVADPLRIAVRALETFRHPDRPERSGDGATASGDEALHRRIEELCEERPIGTFLVGLPLNMDGSPSPRSTEVQAFAAALSERHGGLPVVLWDERLTTKAAEDLLRAEGYRGKEISALRDSWAALVLLRDWIESGEPASGTLGS